MEHRNITGLDALHPFHIRQAGDPGAIGADKGWLDTSVSPPRLRIRNATNTGWDDPTASGASVLPAVANAGARDAAFPAPQTGQIVERDDTGERERYDGLGWKANGQTRRAGAEISTGAKGAVRNDAADDSGVINGISAALGATGVGVIDYGTHRIAGNTTLTGHWRPARGGKLHVLNGVTLHIAGTIDKSVTWQWIVADVGSIIAVDEPDDFDPRWIGLLGTGVAGDEVFLNKLAALAPAAGYGKFRLHPKPGSNTKLAATWLEQNKSGLLHDTGLDPRNSNYNEVPLVEWAGAAGGTMVKFDRMRFSRLAGFSMRPNNADVAIDIDGGGAGIGTQCQIERIFVHDDAPGKPNFVAFRINISGWANQEYHRLVDSAAWGGQNGTFKEGGHDLAQGLVSVDAGSNVVTFSASMLAQMANFQPWDAGVVNRAILIIGPAGQQLVTTVTYASANTGTLAVNAPWTNHAALAAFNRNSANPNPLDGINLSRLNAVVEFNATWLAFGFWNNLVNAKRIRIARADADVSVAALVPTGSTGTTLTRTGANWKENQWKGQVVDISAGAGIGQQREIVSNTNDTLVWSLPLVTALDAVTTNFQILKPKVLDTTITYTSPTTGTLAAAPKIALAGAYFFFGEGMGDGLKVGTNFNTKGIRTERVDTFYFAIGHEITGGSHHSDYDNFNQNDLCFAVGGAISEPITISRMNGESNLGIFRNDTFQPVVIWGSRWAPDRVAPGKGFFRYGGAATVQIMIGNSIDTPVGGMPRGSKVHDFQSDVTNGSPKLVSIGNVFPLNDEDMGYNTLSEDASSSGYVLSIAESSSTMNWVIRGFTKNRNPGQTRFGMAWMFDGWVYRGARKVAPDLNELREGQTVESADPATGMIIEDTRIDDTALTNNERGTLVKRFRMPNTQDTLRNVAGSWNIDGKQGRLRLDCTAGDIFLGLPSNLPVGWEFEAIKVDNTDNIANVSAGGGGTFNGMAGINLIGQFTKLKGRVVSNVAGVNTFECEATPAPRKNPAGPGAIGAQWDPPNIAAGAQLVQQFNIKGAVLGMRVEMSLSLDLQGMVNRCYVDSAGHVTVIIRNGTAAGIDLAALDTRFWLHPLF